MAANAKVDIIIDGIRTRILSGEFGEQGRLPSFRKLVAEYDTSQETMNKAMQALQAEGIILSAGAKGVFVNSTNVRLLGFTPNFYEYLKKQVPDINEEYIDKAALVKIPLEMAEDTKLPDDTIVLRRFKTQGTKQIVFRLEEIFYPKELLKAEAIDKILADPSIIPLNIIQKDLGITIGTVKEKLLCRLPTSYEQKLLKIVRTNPIIDIKRTCYTKNKKKVISYSHILLNANHFLLSYDFDLKTEE